MNLLDWNRTAWDKCVAEKNEWTVPVSPEIVARARSGDWSVILTPSRAVARDWFPETMNGVEILGLASAGGQQMPILAAAGATVTSFDLSPAQLAQDEFVAQREGLKIRTVQGDMRDLSVFPDASFDLIFHPVSNLFIPDPRPVWREAARVLRPGGALLAGFAQPVIFLFDDAAMDRGEFILRYKIPYSDLNSLNAEELEKLKAQGVPLCFGHSLETQIGGQLAAGLVITGYFDDRWPGKPLDHFVPTFAATRALKPTR